jgi:hypothetical protein
MDYSVAELEKFLDYLADKGLMPKQTVVARKSACSKMLSILDEQEKADVRNLELEELTTRFINLAGTEYTPDSLKTYKSRVSKSIESFLRYKENPSGFKVKQSTPKKTFLKQRVKENHQPSTATAEPSINHSQQPLPADQSSGLTLPIPIRDDLVVQIAGLPYDLREAEAQKIANVVLAMATASEF